MVKCCAPKCSNATYNKTPEITLHRFPKDYSLRNIWIRNINRKNWQPHPSSVLCSKHFEDKSICRREHRTVLIPGAIPTIFEEELLEETLSRLCQISNEPVSSPSSANLQDQQIISDQDNNIKLPNDMENYMQYHIMGRVSHVQMKPGCVPTKFDCQKGNDQTIIDTNKKQRKKLCDATEDCDDEEPSVSYSEPLDRLQTTPNLSEQEDIEPLLQQFVVIQKKTDPESNDTIPHLELPFLNTIKIDDEKRESDDDVLSTSTLSATEFDTMENLNTEELPSSERETFKQEVCRCCLSQRGTWDLTASYASEAGESQVFLNMLYECFGITLDVKEWGTSRLICNRCVTSLRQAHDFKRQVVAAERTFKGICHVNNEGNKTEDVKRKGRVTKKVTIPAHISIDHSYSKPRVHTTRARRKTKGKKLTKVIQTPQKTKKILKRKRQKNTETESGRVRTVAMLKRGIEKVRIPNRIGSRMATRMVTRMQAEYSMDDTNRQTEFTAVKAQTANDNIEQSHEMSENVINDEAKTENVLDSPLEIKEEIENMKELDINLELDDTDTDVKEELDIEIKDYQYKKQVTKPVSERKRIRLTCETVLKYTTACPFRHHKSWFQCFYCKQDFIEINELKNHTKEKHTSEDLSLLKRYPRMLQIDISHLKCQICDVNLTDVKNMVGHFAEVHKMAAYQECIADFKLINVNPFTCHICDKKYHVFRSLTTHLNVHYANCVCDICGKSFLNSKRLKVHKRTHEYGNFPCDQCGKILKTKTSKANHMETHSKRVLKCQICFKPMKHYNERVKHMSEAHNITHKFKCVICGREYNVKHYLATHMRQTHGHRDKKCRECGMAFVSNHGLKKHMLKHTDVKEFSCKICTKNFARSSSLKEHLKVHGDCGVF